MSRIIVKGLPKYLTEERLKTHFLERLKQVHPNEEVQSFITDCKILKNRNGESRKFAFIGYKLESDSLDAVKYFDGSYIDTSKLEVGIAKSFADPNVPQSMREKRREALKRLREKEDELLERKRQRIDNDTLKKSNIDSEISKDKKLQEFINTMKPSNHVTSWESITSGKDALIDDVECVNPLLSQALALKANNENEKVTDDEKLSEMESESEYIDLKNDDNEILNVESYEKHSQDDNIARNEQISDMDWLKNRRIRIKNEDSLPQREDDENVISQCEPLVETPQLSEEEKNILKIRSTGRLFLRNILYTATENDFRELFLPFGELQEVHIALDTRTGKSKGFAYILFENPDDAVNAYVELDKQIFQGRLLHILPGDTKKDHRLDEFDLKNLPLKRQRELKRKSNASKQVFSWNSLYMNSDAVLTSVAHKLGLKKSDLIDPEQSNSAVKQALAEAHVIGDVRKYFESHGVDLTKFAQFKNPSERDSRIILLKNFPFGTTREEIIELFLPFGKLERVLMPPSGTIAIVQFRDITAGRAAFSKLSFKRFKDGIIYLENGPSGCFTRDAKDEEYAESENSEKNIKEIRSTVDDLMDSSKESKESNLVGANDDRGIVDGPTVSIFIKNLNFLTTTDELVEKFKIFDGFVVAQVKKKPDPRNPKNFLSMGFGFVEFRTKEQAEAVILAMNDTVLNGHRIQLKLSHRQGNTPLDKSDRKKNDGKIIVKNVPFEATRSDIFELFSSFGQLKSVRVPKKFDKSARGFAFVEFLLPKEAENAMDQLQGVHLLGRRLVMQHAQKDAEDANEQIERMTKKIKRQIVTTRLASMRNNSGKRKLDIDNDDDDGLNGM